MTWDIFLRFLAVWAIASIPCAIAIGHMIARGTSPRLQPRRDSHSTHWLTTQDLWLAAGLVLTLAAIAEGSI